MISQLATSLQYINVVVTALDGDPTGNPVAIAFTAPSSEPQPGDWNSAAWNTGAALGTNQYLARVLVGPGGSIQLPNGSYQMWVRVAGTPEIPQMAAGALTIY